MPLLPNDFDRQTYWQSIYHQPVPSWLPALEQIRLRHRLPAGEWTRFALGRNVVFACDALVVKLSPPFWVHEIPREADALTFVAQRLPVVTPELITTGELEGWAYLVQRRVPGDLLRSRWADLSPPTQLDLVRQQGEVMAALHALPVHNAPASLAFDWTEMLSEQKAECEPEMRNAGVPAPLLADLASRRHELSRQFAIESDLVHRLPPACFGKNGAKFLPFDRGSACDRCWLAGNRAGGRCG